jgi:hypothetical protein
MYLWKYIHVYPNISLSDQKIKGRNMHDQQHVHECSHDQQHVHEFSHEQLHVHECSQCYFIVNPIQ